jgi:hypothetical protein
MRRENTGLRIGDSLGDVAFELQSADVSNACFALTGTVR